jgi:hypothetical protein
MDVIFFFSLILYSMFERFLNLTFISRSYMHHDFLSLSIAGKYGFDGPGIFIACIYSLHLHLFIAGSCSLYTFIAGS